jgi:hypothetical protein
MDVFLNLFSLSDVLVGRGLATCRSPALGDLPAVYAIRKLKEPRPKETTVEPLITIIIIIIIIIIIVLSFFP